MRSDRQKCASKAGTGSGRRADLGRIRFGLHVAALIAVLVGALGTRGPLAAQNADPWAGAVVLEGRYGVVTGTRRPPAEPATTAHRPLSGTAILTPPRPAPPPQPGSGPKVPLAALPVAFPGSGDEAHVALLIEIDGPTLIAGNPGPELRGEILAEAMAADGTRVAGFTQPFVLDLGQERERLENAGIKLFASLFLPTGSYRLAVSASNNKTGALGEIERPLEVPAFAAGDALLSPPLVAEAGERWRTFRQNLDAAVAPPPYPFVRASGGAFLPAAQPEVAAGGELQLDLFGYHLSDGPLSIEGELRDAAGEPVAGGRVYLLDRGAAEAGGRRHLLAGFDTGSLPLGEYRLEVTVRDPRSGASGANRIPLRIVEETAAVAAVEASPVEGPSAEELAIAERALSADSLAALESSYRKILELLGEGRFELAVAALVDLEKRATPNLNIGEAQALRRIEIKEAKAIRRRGSDSLVPQLLLHLVASQRFLDDGEVWRATHSRMRVKELVDLYLKADKRATARAAQYFAVLGNLDAALGLDPTNPLALYRLGFSYEKRGEYLRATEMFERLVAADPDHDEGHLRLANNLYRTARVRAARGILENLIDRRPEPWIGELAFQQLAWSWFDQGRVWAAKRVLLDAVEQYPDNQRLRLMLAFVLEQNRQVEEALSLLDSFTVANDASESPRNWYNRSVDSVVAAARERLVAEGLEKVSHLAGALSTGASP